MTDSTTSSGHTARLSRAALAMVLLLAASALASTAEAATTDHPASSSVAEALVGLRGHATAAGDVNGDGWVDLFVGTFADRPVDEYVERGAVGPQPDRLLLGGPDGFRLDPAFPGELGRTSGAAFADLDGDADLDLVVLRQPRTGARSAAPSVVMENRDGSFVPATTLDSSRGLRSVGVLDFDGDGRLDLYLVEDRFAGGSSVLLRNEGGLRFADRTAAAGLPTDVHGLGVAAADLDGDTRIDLFVAGSNRLFLARNGGFREVTWPHVWETFGSEDDVAGVAVGDVDNDGRLDLLLGQHYNSTIDDGRSVPARLYLNRGNDALGVPRFDDVTDASGLVALPTKAPHVELVDLNSDGLLDVLTSASAQGGAAPAVMLQRPGDTPTFEAPEGLGSPQYWIAGATFDADRDGTRDVFLVEWEPSLPSLLLTTAATGNWLTVQIGPQGSMGVGAVVEVYRSGELGNAAARLASVPVVASTGFGSGAVSEAHIGLGSRSIVDVRVRLPNVAGVIDRTGVRANRTLSLPASSVPPPQPPDAAPSDIPGVQLLVYERPGGPGAPWSQWGQGVVLEDGRFVSAIGDHLGADGNSHVYVYDPGTGRLDLVGDVLSAVAHQQGSWGYGKVHGQMVETSPGRVVFATYWGSRSGLSYTGSYTGDHLMELDVTTMTIRSLGVPLPGHGIPSLDAHGGLVYGEAVEPTTDTGQFFVFDPRSGRVVDQVADPRHARFRGMAIMDSGDAYLATAGVDLLHYEPGSATLRLHGERLPAGELRATTDPDALGTVYAVTQDPARFVAIERGGAVRDLGPAPGYTTSLALDGDRVLFIPGAHGDAHELGAPLMALDTRSGRQSVLVELDPVARAQVGLVLGGSYSLALDEQSRRLYVGMNAGPTAADPWGDIVLAIVDLDAVGEVPSAEPPCGPPTNPAPTPDESAADGYWVLDASGSVSAFGTEHHGDLTGISGSRPVALAASPSGEGYWIAEADGTVHAFGDAAELGDLSGFSLRGSIVAMAAHPTRDGFWLLGSDGGVFSFGATDFHGSTGAMRLDADVVDLAATASGEGYWLVAADGGVFTFGDAEFRGSTGGRQLDAPMVSVVAAGDDVGYWLVAGDGGVFSFGPPFIGSIPGLGLCPAPGAVATAATATSAGFYAATTDGGVFTFGDAIFRGADPARTPDPIDVAIRPPDR